MVSIVCGQDTVLSPKRDWVFGEAGVIGTRAVDVFPGMRGDEGEFVGGDADDVAGVADVEGVEVEVEGAVPGCYGYRYLAYCR